MDKAKNNYEIHDKKILTVILVFKESRRYLEVATYTISVYTDYKNLIFYNDKDIESETSSVRTRTGRLQFKDIFST
jgi:hypothetical protein